MRMDLDAVVFDMDGTLFDSMDRVTDGFIAVLAGAGGPTMTSEQVVDAFRHGPPRRMLDALLGRPTTDDELAEYHRGLSGGPTATYDGIDEALEALATTGARLAVFTGADVRSLELLLATAGLHGRFEVTTGGDEVAHPKPAPDGVLLTCERMGVDPSRAAYVGDSKADMEAARGAGVLAIGAGWGSLWHPSNDADVVAATPSDVVALVGASA
jgi:HAD superfamily hydrolase (TIGR01549 family)